jgi:hypothetical protein
MIRNVVVLSDPIPVSVGIGSVFLQGSDDRTFTIAGKATHYPAIFREAAENGVVKPEDPRESGIDRWLFRVGMYNWRKRLRTNPASIPPLIARKAVRLWYATESGALRQQMVLGVCSLLVVPAALLQLWAWRASQVGFFRMTLVVLCYFAVLHIVTLPLFRYIIPVYPILMVPAAAWWQDRLRRWMSLLSPGKPDSA